MAMISPNYYVNIAKRDEKTKTFRHFCDVEFGYPHEDSVKEKFEELVKRFPIEEGWMLDLRYVECYSSTERLVFQEELC